jgi:hypothetical protein
MTTLSNYITDPQNKYKLIVIGRQSGLQLFKELISEETNPTKKELLKQAYTLEQRIIAAAKREDQSLIDELTRQSRELFAQIRLVGAV